MAQDNFLHFLLLRLLSLIYGLRGNPEVILGLFLSDNDFVCSMSRKGCCWDNAVAESFFHTLKTELVYQEDFQTREEAHQAIFEYIEVFYNRQRKHSTNGYLAPFKYEQQLAEAA